MAKVTFKDNTSLELESGEEIVISEMPEGYELARVVEPGKRPWYYIFDFIGLFAMIFRKTKWWKVNIAVTNKRVAIVPCKNAKYPVESFYYADITEAGRCESDMPEGERGSSTLPVNTQGYVYVQNKDGKHKLLVILKMSFKEKAALLAANTANAAMVKLSYAANQYKVNQGESFSKRQAEYDKDVADFKQAHLDINAGMFERLVKGSDLLAKIIINEITKAVAG